MFALYAGEKDEDGNPTDDAEIGARLEWEFQSSVINVEKMMAAYFKGLIQAANAAPGGRRG